MVRKQITFHGRVQGVGFRYTARHAADSLGLTGWVRNEYDGSVMMQVQGEEVKIDHMLHILNDDMYIDIQDMDIKSLPVIDDDIRFIIQR